MPPQQAAVATPPVVVSRTLYCTPVVLRNMTVAPQRAFIQVRMSSSRFPGKALAPLAGKPVIDRVIDRVNDAIRRENIIVLTSTHRSDDPLVAYLDDSIEVYRGDLSNVFQRYQNALETYPCDRFFRVCGDSPFLEPTLFERAVELADERSFDLLTTKLDGELPLGKNVECLNTETFLSLEDASLSDEEREHICNTFYSNPDTYDIQPISTPTLSADHPGFCVDTVKDIKRLTDAVDAGELDEKRYAYPFDE